MAKEKNITTVVISKEMFSRSDFVASIIPLFFTETRFLEVNSAYEEFFGKIVVDIVSPEWFLRNIARAQHIGYEMSKRALDIVIGVAGMLLCAFVLPAVYAAIKIEDRGPIFYRQTRVGKNGKEFVLFKFRTMHHQRQEQGTLWTQENDSRFTRVGRVLRRIHLDEFPQAWNIIRGDMSFVGPRAERKELAELFEKEIPFYRMRHVVKPGVTGWAQLNFPPSASIDEAKEKLGYDLFYVKNKSFFFDLAIVFKTLTLVFFSIKRKK